MKVRLACALPPVSTSTDGRSLNSLERLAEVEPLARLPMKYLPCSSLCRLLLLIVRQIVLLLSRLLSLAAIARFWKPRLLKNNGRREQGAAGFASALWAAACLSLLGGRPSPSTSTFTPFPPFLPPFPDYARGPFFQEKNSSFLSSPADSFSARPLARPPPPRRSTSPSLRPFP